MGEYFIQKRIKTWLMAIEKEKKIYKNNLLLNCH
jgi:hypothetical protein